MADPTVPLTMVLAKFKAVQPVLFSEFEQALKAYAEPELRGILSAQPSHVLIAQGRAQIVSNLKDIVASCSEKAAQYMIQAQKQGV